MNTRRFTLATGVAAIAALALAGCSGTTGGDSSNGEGMSVAFANYNESVPFFQVIHTTLDGLNPSEHGADVSWYDNKGDASTMLQNVQQMIVEAPDAMVLYPVSSATEGVSKLISDSGIPCVALNIDADACSFLNIDNAALGAESAAIVGKIAKERGWDASNTTVLIGQNAAAGEGVNAAVHNFYSTVADELGFDAVAPDDITPTTTTIGDNGIQFDGVSTLQPSFEAVQGLVASIPADRNIILYTVNNDSTNGALRALEDAGRGDADKLLIAGLGGDETGISSLQNDPRWVAEGDIFVSYWGEYAVAMAQALADGVTPPADVTPLPQLVMDKEQLATYHPDGTTAVAKLPPLNDDNKFLGDTAFLKSLGNVEGVE